MFNESDVLQDGNMVLQSYHYVDREATNAACRTTQGVKH